MQKSISNRLYISEDNYKFIFTQDIAITFPCVFKNYKKFKYIYNLNAQIIYKF